MSCGARLRNDNVLPNEAVRLSIGTNTQELDIGTARVAVKECNVAVNAYVTQHPLSPTESDCGSYAEHELEEPGSGDCMLGTLPEYLRPPGKYVSNLKAIKCVLKPGTSCQPSSERHNMPLLGIVLTGTI